jgi:site-specific recombinase XerD
MQEKEPIRELLEKARASLEIAGYTPEYAERIMGVWNRLETQAISKNGGMYSPEFGEQFLYGYHGLTPYDDLTGAQRDTNRAIKMLNDVCATGYVLPFRIVKGYTFPKRFEGVFTRFLEYRESLDRHPHEIRDTKLCLERFGRFLEAKDITDVAQVDLYIIHEMIQSASALGKSSLENAMRRIRLFFQWAFDAGLVPNDISSLIPKTVYYKRKTLPSVYTPDEVERLLHSVDRGNAMGKRDYAMILLSARTGLRSHDICDLEFGNILWESNRIDLIQQKTGHSLSLPLTAEVGEAIVDYLKHGRPKYSESPKVFVKHVPPDFGPFAVSDLYTHVRKYMHKAKIFMPKARRAGTHALRHSLASLLLEKEVPPAVISGILGHVDGDTTGKYLAIDIKGLRSCALDVSECNIQWGTRQ